MTKNGKNTKHKKFGLLKKIELYRYDPYYSEGKFFKYLPEQSSSLDSFPNILAELSLYTNCYQIQNCINLTPSHYNFPIDVKTEIQGTFNKNGFFRKN
ncbi:MAG: hypothetical protein U1V55_12115 [Planktothrix rubescens PR222]